MCFFRKKKLLTGEALINKAKKLGVSFHDLVTETGIKNEWELQKRVIETEKVLPKPWSRLVSIVSFLVPIIALVFVGLQTKNLTKTFNLEKRPYLYVDLEPLSKYYSDGSIHGGGWAVYKNEGQIPASDVQTEFKVATDDVQGEIDIKKWYEQKLGGKFPEVKTVFPKQGGVKIPINPSINKKAKFLSIEVLVTYSGIEKNKRYWSKFSQMYDVIVDGKNMKLTPRGPIIDWDRDLNSELPPLTIPNWKEYKHSKQNFATSTPE
jgi:hypothetical protein